MDLLDRIRAKPGNGRNYMKTWVLALAAGLAVAIAPASAAVIDFEGGVTDGSTPQSFDGFDFTFIADGWITSADSGCCTKFLNTNGTAVLGFGGDRNGDTGRVIMTASDSSLFSVFSFDAATWDLGGDETLTVEGTFADDSTISAMVTLSDLFMTKFLIGFENLKSLAFIQGTTGDFFTTSGVVIDNINLDPSEIPIPGAFILMGFGLASLASRLRRKKVNLA